MTAAIGVATSWAHADFTSTPRASITGVVRDPLDGRVSGAIVTLLRDGRRVSDVASDGRGQFSFAELETGRYDIEVHAIGFVPRIVGPFFVGSGARTIADVLLAIGLKEQVVVTAAATELPASQVAAPVTVIDHDTLTNLSKPDVLEALRLVPGVDVTQIGGRGGIASVFVRGGQSNFNKILVDGVPINDIGGAFDFADLATTGVECVEVLRDANSVLYGSDAIAGVISLTTRRGQSRIPELSYSADGGNLGTFHQDVSLGGAFRHLDYFSEYSHLGTDNNLPNNAYHNDTFVNRFGWALGSASDLSVTVRHTTSDYSNPSAVDLHGIADDSRQTSNTTYVGVSAHSRITNVWQASLRLASADEGYHYINPSPTGEAFDPFGYGANYLGDPVKIRGANGFVTSGRAILDYGGTYPQTYDASTTRRSLAAQTTYHLREGIDVSAGLRFEHENGFADASSRSSTVRSNAGSFVEVRGALRRLYASAGLGYDHNAVFGSALTPRLSAAWYLHEPSSSAAFGDTKLIFDGGTGIKAPSIFQEQSSVFNLLAAGKGATPAVSPIGPERGRGVEGGVDQGLLAGRLRVRATFFRREFSDLIEFVSKDVLPQLGVSAEAAAATPFGAYVNSSSYRAGGLETTVEARVGGSVRVAGSYTYLDAVVTKSFTGSVLAPAINPAYPGIPIGAYAPLVGAAPFRRPKHTGNVMVTYANGPGQLSLAGYFVGKSDDSTFLSDGSFGNTLLLPNHDLLAGYQKVDLSGSYRMIRSRLRAFFSIENLLDKRYEAAFGFAALPRTFRIGLTGTIGGDGVAPGNLGHQ